ncbi:MAG: hypothetical protein MI799_24885, partial [Desulfobacterales bacterium]|nr:hypothetical protein [Desulfobacterales bacterium]
ETARAFAKKIDERPEFELVTPPELNILTYRLVPLAFRQKLAMAREEKRKQLNRELDEINIRIQRIQREAGKSFVSRTRLKLVPEDDFMVVVLRSAVMTPIPPKPFWMTFWMNRSRFIINFNQDPVRRP